MKVLIEGVIQVPSGQSMCLTIAVYLANLISQHKYMSALSIISLTCSTTELSADLLVILSSFGVVPTTFVSLTRLPHNELDPQGICPIAGQRFGPPFFDSLLSDISSQHLGTWDPLSYLRLILDSLRGVSFECTSAGLVFLFIIFSLLLRLICLFYVIGLSLPEVFSPFSSTETNAFISFVVSDWSSVLALLDLPDLMGGLRGLRPHLKLSALQTRCVRLCLIFLQEVISVLQSHCPEVNRGDASALVSAFSEISSVIVTMTDMFIPSVYGVPRERRLLLLADFSFSSADPNKLLSTPKMDHFVNQDSFAPETLALIKKRLLSFLSSLFMSLQEVITHWFNGGLVFFDVFSASSLEQFDIDGYQERFERLTAFLQNHTLVDGSLISSWKSQYPSFARRVVDAVSVHPIQSIIILSFWLESGCLKDFVSFRYIWDVICSLGADITESHHFENERFDFDVPISPAEFQWGVELVWLFQPSWQDDHRRGMWSLPSSVEETLRNAPALLSDRQKIYGTNFISISRSVFILDLAKYQLVAINHLMDQGILDYKSLSPRKLKAIQLALGLSSKKLPKTLAISKNRLEVKLSNLNPPIPSSL